MFDTLTAINVLINALIVVQVSLFAIVLVTIAVEAVQKAMFARIEAVSAQYDTLDYVTKRDIDPAVWHDMTKAERAAVLSR